MQLKPQSMPQFYLRMTRLSATKFKLERYVDSARTILVSAPQTRTLSGDPQGLDWFKVTNRDVGGAGVLNLKIENVRIWDGITNPVTQETATFTDNFASDNWTNIEGSSVGVSGGVLAYDAYTGGGSSGDGEYRDYGSVLSDTFVWRFKWNATTVVKGSNLANNEVNISISSNNSKNDIVNDAVGFLLRVDSASKQLHAGIWDNTAPASTASTNTVLESLTFSAGTYYCEVVRHSNRKFTFTIYNDVDFSEVVYTTTLTNSAYLLDLQYFKVTTDHETSADSANDGSLDDFKLYNGVTQTTNYWQEIGT